MNETTQLCEDEAVNCNYPFTCDAPNERIDAVDRLVQAQEARFESAGEGELSVLAVQLYDDVPAGEADNGADAKRSMPNKVANLQVVKIVLRPAYWFGSLVLGVSIGQGAL